MKVNLMLLTTSWTLSFLVMVLTALFGGLVRTEEVEQCEFSAKGKVGHLLVSAMTFIPWFLIAGASIAVIVRAFKIYFTRRAPAPAENARDGAQFMLYRRRLQVAKMLLLSFIWGTLCKLPYFVTKSVAPMLFALMPLLPSWFKIIIIAEYTFNPVSITA
ncbi:hypothetical protein RvY_18058 [Ramazzottius varieornatus]|uniref:G-protein coupled receptors family 1 profile domain-containing protein n=1 Tax=Ramazzottius varieornatus TaxID=947166 RepID=A0A1D1W7X9_RAMVA|nr:hypothetical protein RvY_18058 [Ramazzottius varieornatus]